MYSMSEGKETAGLINVGTILTSICQEQKCDDRFAKLCMYGSVYDTMFVAKDIQDMLELKDINYRGARADTIYRRGIEIKTVKIDTGSGLRPKVVFTEQGLMKALNRSSSPAAEPFQDFVYEALRRLRALDLSGDCKKLEAKLRETEEVLDAEHSKLMDANARFLQMENDSFTREIARYRAREAVETSEPAYVSILGNRYITGVSGYPVLRPLTARAATDWRHMAIEEVRRNAKPVHIMLMPIPKEYAEEYTYDISHIPLVTEQYIFGLQAGKTESKTRSYAATVYIHPGQKIDVLHDHLAGLGIRLRYRKNEGYYANCYAASLDLIAQSVWDLYVRNTPAPKPEHGVTLDELL